MIYEQVKTDCMKHLKEHCMEVLRDDGVYRDVLFKKPGTVAFHFHLVTWPGHLCFCGDIGTFVFRRLDDMFEFFGPGDISWSYWHEKLVAHDHREGSRGLSKEVFLEAVKTELEESGVSLYVIDKALEEWSFTWDCNPTSAIQQANEKFRDFFEHSTHDYTYGFVWACYAIQWGIQLYRDQRSKKMGGVVLQSSASRNT